MTYTARNIPEGNEGVHANTPLKPDQKTTAEPEAGSFFNQLSSKSALIVGLVTSVLTMCTLGFIILLTIFLKSYN